MADKDKSSAPQGRKSGKGLDDMLKLFSSSKNKGKRGIEYEELLYQFPAMIMQAYETIVRGYQELAEICMQYSMETARNYKEMFKKLNPEPAYTRA